MTPQYYIPAIQTLNILGLIGVIVINILSNVLPINDLTAAEISDQYHNLFTPAGFAFSIWSIIYLGLIAFSIFQLWETRDNRRPEILSVAGSLGITFFINCLANIGWIISWHYQMFSLSLLLMSIILLSLIDINRRLYQVTENYRKYKRVYLIFRWSVIIPFGLYLGWICIASIANAAVYFKYTEWSAFGVSEQSWASFMVVVGAIIGLWTLARFRLVSAAAAIGWGIACIYFNIWNTENTVLAGVCIVMLLLLLAGIARFVRKNRIANL